MQYLHAPNRNYEDYASGRVLYHRSGLSTFPVRLASELFLRACEYLDQPQALRVYDPLCGEAYLLTSLGFLHGEQIGALYGSDINPQALEFAAKNLALLTEAGFAQRQAELQQLYAQYGKDSHQQALQSLTRLRSQVRPIPTHLFQADMLKEGALAKQDFQADIIITDLPYGNMVDWQGQKEAALDTFLLNLKDILQPEGVLVLISDKSQKGQSPHFQRLKLLRSGKRRIEFLRLAP